MKTKLCVLAVVLCVWVAWPSAQPSSIFSNPVLSGSTCPPTIPPGISAALYTCTGTGALYTWTGSAWSVVTGGGGGGLTVGTTTITSGSNRAVLYDNAGVLGNATNVTVNLTGIVSAGLDVEQTSTVNDDAFFVAASIANTVVPTNTHPFSDNYGLAVYDSIGSSNTQDIDALYGVATFVTADGNTGADYAAVSAYYATIGSGNNNVNIPLIYAFFLDWGKSAAVGTGTWTTAVSFYVTDMAAHAQATNMYYQWFDSRGVYRVREDNTFNSVYQAIPTLYNPQFTKYTPGATNFERCIPGCQWESNVGVITTEAGGTGTLRGMRIGDTGVSIEYGAILNGTALKTDTTTAHTALIQAYDVDGATYRTFATLTNANVPTMTLASPSGGTLLISSWTGPSVLTEAVGSSGLTLTGATQTTSQPALNMTQTWNAGGVVFTGMLLNVTSTASAATSLLMDLQVGSVTQANINKGGQMFVTGDYRAGGSYNNPQLFVGAFSGTGYVSLNAAGNLQFSSTSDATATADVILNRVTANSLGQRNGANAQTFSVYNTFTSGTSFELFNVLWSSSVLHLGNAKGSGGGSARVMQLDYGGTTTSAISIPITSGDITLGGSVFPTGYKSADGSAGVTVTNCTSFKNGICVAGT